MKAVTERVKYSKNNVVKDESLQVPRVPVKRAKGATKPAHAHIQSALERALGNDQGQLSRLRPLHNAENNGRMRQALWIVFAGGSASNDKITPWNQPKVSAQRERHTAGLPKIQEAHRQSDIPTVWVQP